jgi:integrase/recombinase XerD
LKKVQLLKTKEMQHLRTFTILFWINTSRIKNDEAKIYARVTVNGKRANISLKYKVAVSNWNKEKSRALGKGQESRMINHYLDQVHSKLFKCYQELKGEEKLVTAVAIKNRFLGKDTQHYSMRDLIDYHNKTMEHKLNKHTMRHYRTSQSYILLLINRRYKSDDIYLKNITYSFIMEFENLLRSLGQGRLANNTIMKHIQRLRKMMTMAYHLEWINKDPFVRFKAKIEKVERGFLTDEELKRMEQLPCTTNSLQLVKDLFIFSCYTGIAYSDIMLLTEENMVYGLDGYQWITTKRKKSGTIVKIPLLPKALSIIQSYVKNPRSIIAGTLFPKMSNQKINGYLKEIATLCNIQKNLTFHIARHTFATTVTLSNGVPIETVSKILGHSTIRTTQIYAKVVEQKISEDMFQLRQKLAQTNNSKIANK